jgi:glycerol-3-phosphate dehydrogenase
VQTEKWTTVRALAERTVDALARAEGLEVEPSQTRFRPLHGGESAQLTPEQKAAIARLDAPQGARLKGHYGGRLGRVLDLIAADPRLADTVPGAPSILRAELRYAIEDEMGRTAADLLRRIMPGLPTSRMPELLRSLAAFVPVPDAGL